MSRAYYSAAIEKFLKDDEKTIIGELNHILEFDRDVEQQYAWEQEISVMKEALLKIPGARNGRVLFEYSIPRLCGRLDVVVLLGQTVLAIEFKVGEKEYAAEAKKQVLEYCLDLKYFHENCEEYELVPILICTKAHRNLLSNRLLLDKLHDVSCCHDSEGLSQIIVKYFHVSTRQISIDDWLRARYSPSPTIVEVAVALFEHHDVKDITKTSDDSKATNLTKTTVAIKKIIEEARQTQTKKICFVTGVPGAGKTLVGLNLATDRELKDQEGTNPVFLSGNGPLVDVLQHALQQDAKKRQKLIKKLLKERGIKDPPKEVQHYFTFALKKTFVQGIYGFLKDALEGRDPNCRLAIFDESQRCWTKERMTNKHKTNTPSEASCLIGQLNKNLDWSVIVCLVGGGQEIHTGESGIVEWLKAINEKYTDWDAYVSDELKRNPTPFDVELPGAENKVAYQIDKLVKRGKFNQVPELHLNVSLRSFRNEKVSAFANAIVENRPDEAKRLLPDVLSSFPVAMTRNLEAAKNWVRTKSKKVDNLYLERFGAVASSGASRIRPEGIVVPGLEMNVPKWMLGSEHDVDSSYFLELAASEFKIQGLEIDYSLLIWESDYRYDGSGFSYREFRKGRSWGCIRNATRQNYLRNAYRVLLTRARQGMIIYVPKGCKEDQTRYPGNYNGTYCYLKSIGIPEI